MTSAVSTRPGVVLTLLAAAVALGPLSTDAYVPGLPRLAADLHAPAAAVQLTVTACLIGLAAGQLVAGPLSDTYGRRKMLLAGLALYTVAGLLCAVAPDVTILVLMRGLQGVGGTFALVIAVRRRPGRPKRDRGGPLLLAVVAGHRAGAGARATRRRADSGVSGWREIFVALAALSGVLLLACLRALPESLPVERRQPGGPARAAAVYRGLLKDRVLVGYALTNALVFATMFAYIAGSPFVLQDLHGLSPQQYSVVFAANAAGLVVAAQVSGRLVGRAGARALLSAGAFTTAAGALGFLLSVLAGAGLPIELTALFVAVAGVGLVLPNAPALALEQHGAHAGAAAALLGCAQFLLGGLAAPLVGAAGAGTALPMALVMVVLAGAALAALFSLARR